MATLFTLAQYRIEYGNHMDGGGWRWGMFAVMVLIALAVVALVAWLVRTTRTPPPPPGSSAQSPMEILDRRLASGEITPEDYRQRAEILGGR